MKNTSAADLKLPRFDIPDLPAKPMPPEAYRAWLTENRQRLMEDGRLEPILADPVRCPVDARFSLDGD